MRSIKSIIFVFMLILLTSHTLAEGVSILPSNITVSQGQTYNLNISINSQGIPVTGCQLDLIFNPSLIRVNSTAGMVADISGGIAGDGNVSTSRIFVVDNVTAVGPSDVSYNWDFGDGNTGIKNGVEIIKGGVITLKRKNLLKNPFFKIDNSIVRYDLDGLAENWWIWNPSNGNYSTKLDQTNFTGSSKLQKLTFHSNNEKSLYLAQTLNNIESCRNYTFSADVKIDNPKQVEVEVWIQFYNNSKYLGTYKSNSIDPVYFTKLNVTATAGPEVNRLKVLVVLKPKFAGASGNLWIDSAQLEQSEHDTEYLGGYEFTRGEYISSPVELGTEITPYKIEWTSSVQPEANIKFQIRNADTIEKLISSLWYGPTGLDDYYSYYSKGDNLLFNPSLEKDIDNNGIPEYSRKMGWGTNDRTFTIVNDAFEGTKAVKVEITNYSSGDARWEILFDGEIEKNSDYSFSLWHKENGDMIPIWVGVGLEKEGGIIKWGYTGKNIQSSSTWKKDTVAFYIPDEIVKKIWVKIVLKNEGWIISDAYDLRKMKLNNEWKINPLHNNSSIIQYKVDLISSDPLYSPSLHDITIKCGDSTPEIQWINILDNNGNQKYAFQPGDVANFNVEILDFKGISNIEYANILIYDTTEKVVTKDQMIPGPVKSDIKQNFGYQFTFPEDSIQGLWKAEIIVVNKDGKSYTETVFFKSRQPYISPPQKMTLGVLATDYGFNNYQNYNKTIEAYRKYEGIDIWKLSISWDILEPEHGSFNEEYIDAIIKFMDAAHDNKAKVQIGIKQQNWPMWVNNGYSDNKQRYSYEITERLADTWMRLAQGIKDHHAFESYLIVNEENHVYDADIYLRGSNKIITSIRTIDGNPDHRITIRPNTVNSYIRSRIASDGMQDYEYGAGVYPTSWAWYLDSYDNPVSKTSFLRMSRLRSSPLAYGGPGGVGEIGFFKAKSDTFGDEEKLSAYKRALSIAYEQGMDEFMLWEGPFSFENPQVYFPELKEFRDNLIKYSRTDYFNVRVIIDNNDWLWKETYPLSSKLDMNEQPYFLLIKTLDEKGYSWFYTHSDDEELQEINFDTTIRLSEIKGKNQSEQNKIIIDRLRNVTPSGKYYPWPIN